ncbi:MAG: CAP domain-containing protein [Bacteroidota bacterium]
MAQFRYQSIYYTRRPHYMTIRLYNSRSLFFICLLTWGFVLTSASTWAQPGKFTEAQLAEANTAKAVSYLSEEEKQVVFLTNLARLDGALFAQTYLQAYLQQKQKKESKYVQSLVAELKKVKNLPMLHPHEKLYQSAIFHAQDMGKKGLMSHDSSDGTDFFTRIKNFLKPPGNYRIAENCAYGFSKATDIVMQLLIDEGIPALGHRNNMLSAKFDLVGVSIQPHKTYRYNCVQDFATLK